MTFENFHQVGGDVVGGSATTRRSRVGTLAPERSFVARRVSKNIRPMPNTAAPAIPRMTQVLRVDDDCGDSEGTTCGRRRFGPFHTCKGTQRVIYAKASDAHTGQTCCSCNSSQSRHRRAVRSCIHPQFTTDASARVFALKHALARRLYCEPGSCWTKPD